MDTVTGNGFDAALTAEDHAYRLAAETYFSEKSPVAAAAFEDKLLAVFHSFEDHWRRFFAPDEPEAMREYLASPFEVRKAQFERFRRECRSWEVSFRHCRKDDGREARAASERSWSEAKRRLDERAEQVRELYQSLDDLFDRERRRRSHPIELLVHLRALGLSSDASLEDIKKQYKRLAKLHHPDRNGDAAKMSRINDAYRAIVSYYRVA